MFLKNKNKNKKMMIIEKIVQRQHVICSGVTTWCGSQPHDQTYSLPS